ncbi:unnamed protein product, partial [marine sediment metagenome]
MVSGLSKTGLTRAIRKPGFWLLVAVMVIITLPHYAEVIEHPTFLTQFMVNLGLDR